MSRKRQRLLMIMAAAALLATGTALSQLSAHAGFSREEKVECRPLSMITREDYLADGACRTLPTLETGDILLTFSTHTFGWRHGHAGIVVDAERGLVLEAVVLGQPTSLVPVKHWERYSTLLALRLKDAKPEVRQAIADFALNNLNNIPYRLTSGLFGAQSADSVTAQCAYLVWYAFDHYGYDLDSDGGRLVTVSDLASSPLLEAVNQ